MHMKTFLMTLLISASLAACGRRGPSKDEIDRMVDDRLAERGFARPGTSASATPLSSASKPTGDPNPQVAASMSFLRQLDELMKGYEPELPQVVDNTDTLRCVTSYASQTNPTLKRISSTALADRERSRKAREKARSEFMVKSAPLAYHIDSKWATRGSRSTAAFGCYSTAVEVRHGTDFRCTPEDYPAQWIDIDNQAECESYHRIFYACFVSAQWKQKTAEGPFLYTYSGRPEAPSSPPAIMQRMEAAGIRTPDRFACRVRDVIAREPWKVVLCDGQPETAPIIRLANAPSSIPNVGDVVTVAIDPARDPDGAVFRWSLPAVPKGPAMRSSSGVWTVDADGATLKVDDAAKCPSLDDIVSSMDAGKD